ncbi:lycopene cyclase domain-containing protein [Algoriphagus sp. CAU 1675]|uniref:lycopene cyclase domain-containing protein n=1 Tax=Algoriphagus sp. CAU 1675 TaxID=3032597 RepID=UPI0023DC6036|nr:lycopene cyclase domain-containing protein [Algoriphagus sp. CAU 1675]MDF2157848.1 lycopene cyclase domain-containing protein [Algoriphagus sp. CAU 1675]
MLEDKYAYLSLSLLYVLAWALVYWKSPWKSGMIKVGAVGGIMGVIAEVWYFRDYWRPPTLFGEGIAGIEDYIIGFALFGVGGYIHSAITNKEVDENRTTPAKNRDFFFLFLIGCASLTVFSVGFGIHSGYVTFLTFFLLSVYIWIQRPDLIGISIFSAFATLAISFIIYYINFNLLFPHFWDEYGMLDQPVLGFKILNIPLSEMLWHFTWAMLCSMFRGYRNGVYYKEN